MNAIEKHLVKQSLKEFEGGTAGQKEIWIHDIQEKLKEHERGLKHIGMGYADHFVTAGRIFLRIQGVRTHKKCKLKKES